jgi:hypothetical protein
MWDLDGDPPSRATLFGHFDVRRDFGVVDETGASTLLRTVLVR